MASGGGLDGGSGRRGDRSPHLPMQIEDNEWEETPASVRNHVCKLNYDLECMANFQNEGKRLKKQLTKSDESLKASKLAVTKLKEEQTAMEAKVTELELKLEGKEGERRICEENAAALKSKVEESEGKRKACEEKISEFQQQLEKSEEKWRVSEANAAALQAKMEGVQMELEGVREQLDEEVSKSTKIIGASMEETEKWKIKAMKYKAAISKVRGAVSEFSDDEPDKDDDISQAPNIDQPPQTPPPNSSTIQNNANTQPDQCVIQNANNKSAQETNMNGNMEGLNAEDKIMNLDDERESTTSASGHYIEDNLSSSSSEDSPSFSPISSNLSVNEGPLDDANSESEENTGLNEDTSNTSGSRSPPTPEATLNPSQGGSPTQKPTKRPMTDPECNASPKKTKASDPKDTRFDEHQGDPKIDFEEENCEDERHGDEPVAVPAVLQNVESRSEDEEIPEKRPRLEADLSVPDSSDNQKLDENYLAIVKLFEVEEEKFSRITIIGDVKVHTANLKTKLVELGVQPEMISETDMDAWTGSNQNPESVDGHFVYILNADKDFDDIFEKFVGDLVVIRKHVAASKVDVLLYQSSKNDKVICADQRVLLAIMEKFEIMMTHINYDHDTTEICKYLKSRSTRS